ncbi:MAG: heparinase II/III family protein [Clostridia bacterium]|nr:heparinase II/III family protein [Clostridia bacterium]
MKTKILSGLVATFCAASVFSFFPQPAKADYISTKNEVLSEAKTKGFASFYPGADRAVTDFGIVSLAGESFKEDGMIFVPMSSLDYIFLTNHTKYGGLIYVDGKDVTTHTRTKDGIDYISLKVYADTVGLKMFDDSLSDLYLVGQSDVSYTWHNDRKMLSGIIGQMFFDLPDASKIISDIEKKNPDGNHPRIMATDETFERIRQETGVVSSDSFQPLKEYWLSRIKAQAKVWTDTDLPPYGPTDHIRMRQHSGILYGKVGFNAFMYKVTGDETYAQNAWEAIETVSGDEFPDWNPIHLLDTGQIMNGMALGYDWLYDWLNDEQKALMRRAIVDKGMAVMCDIYDGKPVYSSWSPNPRAYYFFNQSDNWNFVCCGGALMAALAIYDDCEGEDRQKCEQVLEDSVKAISYGVTCMSPSGDWYEGPAYARLTNETLTETCASLISAAGTDYGILQAPGVLESSEVPFALIGEYSFNISNAGEVRAHEIPSSKELFFYADYFGRDDFANQRFMLMADNDLDPCFRDMIYCTRSFDPKRISLNTDYYLKTSEIVTMRNADVKNGLIFAGLHGGANKPAQGHLDIGEFVIDSFGDRFASDLGLEDYNLMIPYYEKYRNRAEGHNTLVINPNGRVYDQSLDATGIIRRHEYNSSSSIAVVDMTEAYEGYATSATRGMKFTNNRTSILLQDEVRGITPTGNNENELYWFMHTKANITLLNNNKVAELDINGNKMYATLLTDGEFAVMEPKPLPSSPNGAGQNPNKGFQKLFIHLSGVENADIAVFFTPGIYYQSTPLPAVTPISTWTLDGSDTEGSSARLTSLTVDGNIVEDFNPDVFAYEYNRCQTGKMPVIKAESTSSVSVEYPDSLPGNAFVTVGNSSSNVTYRVSLSEENDIIEKSGYKKLGFREIISSSPNSYMSADENTATSVILGNGESVTYKLNEKSLVNYVIAKGTNVDAALFVSSDGINYEYASELKSDGETVFFADKTLTHLKLTALSDSVSISEFGAYTFDGFEYGAELEDKATIDVITALYQTGTQTEKRPLTFEGFTGEEDKNSMPDGLDGTWSYGYSVGSKLKILSYGNFGKNGDGLRFEAHQKYVEDTNGDGRVNASDDPVPGTEDIADNDFQYPRLYFVPNDMGDEFEISFSANFKGAYLFMIYSSLDGSFPIVSYAPQSGISLMNNLTTLDAKNNPDKWYDFEIIFKSDGSYSLTVTDSEDTLKTQTVTGTSDMVKSYFDDSKKHFRFQQNSYPYQYHEVLLDDIYIGKKTEFDSPMNESKKLVSVRSQKISLSDKITVTDKFDIPDDGKKYEASVFVWKDNKLIPIIKNNKIN